MMAYRVYIHLASNEWGNEFMRQVADEFAKDHPDNRPLIVSVHEHAGWYLSFLYGAPGIADGTICETANDSAVLPRAVLDFGVSHIDAGSRVELGGYTQVGKEQVLEREQFALGDLRPLEEVVRELLQTGHIPSWCTSCYRLGRTGEHFMEYAIPGFIQNFCTPNALTTLMEYLVDYAGPETRAEGERLIAAELAKLEDGPRKKDLIERLRKIKETDERDLYF